MSFSAPLRCLAVALVATSAFAGIDDVAQTPAPTFTSTHVHGMRLVTHLMKSSHYADWVLDDAESEKILESYLRRLDPARSFFLRRDIRRFESLSSQFDDFIRQGKLQPVYAIFNIYRTRVEQRVLFARSRLQQDFDFTLDERMPVSRDDESDWADSETTLNEIWRKRVKNDVLNLKLAGKEETDIRELLDKRYANLLRQTRQISGDDVLQFFINAYAGNLEPHTSYFSPQATDNFKINLSLSLEGIGAVLFNNNETTQVREIIPGGPADLAGELQIDDRIIGVAQDDEEMVDIIGWRISDVVELIRGPRETVVRLQILPGGEGVNAKPRVISIRRDKVKLEQQAAKKRVLELTTDYGDARIGVIDLPTFYADYDAKRNNQEYNSSTRDVRDLVLQLKDEGIDGLIIDLRNNRGGALPEAIGLSGLFIDQGPVVQVKSNKGHVKVRRDPTPGMIYAGPLAVLVNAYSASAAEIFAGAIQDYQRGLIIGEPTFGKGTVQHLVDLNQYVSNSERLGQFKITLAEYFRVSGDGTQRRGVVPDIQWSNAEHNDEIGERAYDNALPWDKIARAEFTPNPGVSEAGLDLLLSRHLRRANGDPEFEFIKAVEAVNRENRDIQSVSLNQKTRRAERDAFDARRLELENQKRRALGEQTFADVAALDEDKAAQRKRENDQPEDDYFLEETGRILVDRIYFERADSATRNKLLQQNQERSVVAR